MIGGRWMTTLWKRYETWLINLGENRFDIKVDDVGNIRTVWIEETNREEICSHVIIC